MHEIVPRSAVSQRAWRCLARVQIYYRRDYRRTIARCRPPAFVRSCLPPSVWPTSEHLIFSGVAFKKPYLPCVAPHVIIITKTPRDLLGTKSPWALSNLANFTKVQQSDLVKSGGTHQSSPFAPGPIV